MSVGSLGAATAAKKPEATPGLASAVCYSSAQAVSAASAAQRIRCCCCSRSMVAAWWSIASQALEMISALVAVLVMFTAWCALGLP